MASKSIGLGHHGNTTQHGSESLEYSVFNKTTKITGSSLTPLTYGPDHQLYKEVSSTATGGTKTTYKLDGYTLSPNETLRLLESGTIIGGLTPSGYLARKLLRQSVKTGVASRAGTRGYRYVSKAEIQAIKDTGILRGGKLGETYFTKDVYKSGIRAQDRLSLTSTPTHRVEFEITNNPTMMRNGTKVDSVNPHSGKGAEFMTTDPVSVNLINVQPLR